MSISVTSVFCAFLRGFHSAYEQPVIFDDPFAFRLIPDDRMAMIMRGFAAMNSRAAMNADASNDDPVPGISRAIQAMPTTAQVLSRSAYAERVLGNCMAHGVSQYVVLGAGFDSFCLRKPAGSGVRVFEVDAAETQAFKKEQIMRVNGTLPERTAFVPVDLSVDDVSAALAAAGFSAGSPCFVSMLGLVMYLDEAEIGTLLGCLSRACASGSEIVFDCFNEEALDPSKCSPSFRAMLAQAELTGERYRSSFSEGALRDIARSRGFSVKEYLGQPAIDAMFFAGRGDAYRACDHVSFVRLVRA